VSGVGVWSSIGRVVVLLGFKDGGRSGLRQIRFRLKVLSFKIHIQTFSRRI
jgi:hypothetical protein